MSDDNKVGLVCVIFLFLLFAGVAGCEYHRQVIMPLQMADKGYCLTFRDNGSGSYIPCPKANPNSEK